MIYTPDGHPVKLGFRTIDPAMLTVDRLVRTIRTHDRGIARLAARHGYQHGPIQREEIRDDTGRLVELRSWAHATGYAEVARA